MEYIDLNLHYTGENNDYGNGIISNPLHLFFQEIELAIKIGPQEIWGIRYSIDLAKYLFNQYITITRIQEEMRLFIANNCEQAKNFQHEINVKIIKIDNRDLIHIDTIIYDNDSENKFVQQFMLGN